MKSNSNLKRKSIGIRHKSISVHEVLQQKFGTDASLVAADNVTDIILENAVKIM